MRIAALVTTVCLACPARAELTVVEPPAEDVATRSAPVAAFYSFSGSCNATAQPDLALIVGGVSAQGLKPTAVKTQLEKQLAELERYATQVGGKLRKLETLRVIRPTGNPSDHAEQRTPFSMVQRVQFELPAEREIDPVLEKVLQLGLDSYGEDVGLYGHSGSPQVVVRYGFSGPRAVYDRIASQCRRQALAQWCRTGGAAAPAEDDCENPEWGARNLRLQQLYLQSQPVYQAPLQLAPVVLNYPHNEATLRDLQLLGNRTLNFSGSVTLGYPPPMP